MENGKIEEVLQKALNNAQCGDGMQSARSGFIGGEAGYAGVNNAVTTTLGNQFGSSGQYLGYVSCGPTNETIILEAPSWYVQVSGKGVKAVSLSLPYDKKSRREAIHAAVKALRAQLKGIK